MPRATHSVARDAANVVNRVAGGSRLLERRPAALHAGRREGVPCGTNVMTSKYASSRVLSMLDLLDGVAAPANAQLPLPSCAQATSTPAGRAERAVEAQPWSRRALTWPSTAPHSIARWTAVCLQVLEAACAPRCMTCTMPRLNPNEKCRQNPRVIHSASQLECARVRAADRGDVGHAARRHRQRRRRRARDGVNDPPIAHWGTLRVRGMGSFTPSLVLYSRRCSPCRAA